MKDIAEVDVLEIINIALIKILSFRSRLIFRRVLLLGEQIRSYEKISMVDKDGGVPMHLSLDFFGPQFGLILFSFI